MTSSDPVTTLTTLTGVDVASADAGECAQLLGSTRRLRGWVDAFEAQVTGRIAELHRTEGAAPPADQHTTCGGVSAAEGKRKERRAKAIDDAPTFGGALESGDIGAEHVDALANATAKLDEAIKDQLLDREDDLLDDARRMTPEAFGRSCNDLARRLERDHGIERSKRQRRQTFLSRTTNPSTGMVEGRFAFHPELAGKVFGPVDRHVKALIAEGEQAGDPECRDRSVDRNRLAAEALGELVSAGQEEIRPGHADVTAIVDATTLTTGELDAGSVCETGSGEPLAPSAVQRLACNGKVTPIFVDGDGNALDVGRTVRHANRAQRRALRAMYRTCALGGCDVEFDRCEIHHIVPWELGGATDLANLVPACSRHHHLIHEYGWTVELAPDRTLTVREPDGSTYTVTLPDVPPQRNRARAASADPDSPCRTAPSAGRPPDRQPAA